MQSEGTASAGAEAGLQWGEQGAGEAGDPVRGPETIQGEGREMGPFGFILKFQVTGFANNPTVGDGE